MSEDNHLDHFELTRHDTATHRRAQGPGGRPPQRNQSKHGRRLLGKTEAVLRSDVSRRRPAGITPRLVFRLALNKKGSINEDQLSRMGLTFVSRDPDKTIVVFASDGHLDRFRSYLRQYGGLVVGSRYSFLAAIDDITPLGREERLGHSLRSLPVGTDEIAALDVELMHPGERQAALKLVEELRGMVSGLGGRVSDSYVGSSLALVRCHCAFDVCDAVLETDFVMSVDRPPQPAFDVTQILGIDLDALPEIDMLPDDTPGVLVMDTGIMAGHPLLGPIVGDTASFIGTPDRPDPWPPSVDPHGHGTGVCGIAAYGDLAKAAESGAFRPSAQVFSGRVLDEKCHFDPDRLAENQLADCVSYFVEAYPQCKVVNLSLGNGASYLRPDGKQLRLAARLDELAYELGGRDIVFVVSSGNLLAERAHAFKAIYDRYPDHLLDDRARIIDPATSAIALTVGSVSTGGAPEVAGVKRRCVAGMDDYPSPFTRTGPGVGGMIKPDLVHYGGDLVFEGEGLVQDRGACIPTTSHEFAPPNARLFAFDMGTSYAAAAVSNLAARLFARFPGATSNLVRALLADSSALPEILPAALEGPECAETLRMYGYGRPDLERAAFSSQDRVLLLFESTMPVDGFHLFEVPPLPPGFLSSQAERRLTVTLAFDPPTRHTRGDSYLGVTMGYDLFRNTALGEVEPIFRDWKRDLPGDGEDELRTSLGSLKPRQRVQLYPGSRIREKGTLQKGTVHVGGGRWAYDDGPLLLAVHCSCKWAPPEVESQRYAVIVSISHSDPNIRLWDHVRSHARVMSRVRVRVQSR